MYFDIGFVIQVLVFLNESTGVIDEEAGPRMAGLFLVHLVATTHRWAHCLMYGNVKGVLREVTRLSHSYICISTIAKCVMLRFFPCNVLKYVSITFGPFICICYSWIIIRKYRPIDFLLVCMANIWSHIWMWALFHVSSDKHTVSASATYGMSYCIVVKDCSDVPWNNWPKFPWMRRLTLCYLYELHGAALLELVFYPKINALM